MNRSAVFALTATSFIVCVALLAPLIVSASGLPAPEARDTAALSSEFGTPTGPGEAHLLGVDGLGRDVLSRAIYGTRVAMLVAIPAAILTILIGGTLGMLAGLRGGIVDTVISRLADVFLVIPFLVLAAGIASSCSIGGGCAGGALKPGIPLVVMVIVAAGWPIVTRVIRSEARTLRSADFVASARASGLSTARIVRSEILPNLSGLVAVFFAVLIPQAVLAEAALTFIGVGVPATTASWGQMIAAGADAFPDAWWLLAVPGLALLFTVTSFTLLAEVLRDNGLSRKVDLREVFTR